ncbi:MAG TPA: ABC transporter ATP-binding protein [Devosia sp.]|jgi:peptide/nickel transport system ATP-binding protein|nr:ABC transporter ATP-binding protein [Devosia sp.]
MPLLEVDRLWVRFGEQTAVREGSFSVEPGERFGIIGESGSGKTLTAMAIADLLPESASRDGHIRLDGRDLPRNETDMARLRGKRMGIIFQEPMTALNPLLRIKDQIGEALALNAKAADQVPQLLEEVGLLAVHGERFPHQLSGGQRQRAMIAMALASEPDLLIADEPTSALDLITQRRVLDLIKEICTRRQMALIFISHDLKAVASLCDRVAVMHQGRIVETGRTEDIFVAPEQAYTKSLVAASRFSPARRRPAPSEGAPLLKVEDLTRDYRQGGLLPWRRTHLRAVEEVSFAIDMGECLALVGPSGCGKSTLARMIVGLDTATAGTMEIEGARYRGGDLPKSHRAHLSLVFQDPFGSFNPRLTVGASLAEPLRLKHGLAPMDHRARLVEAVEAVGLDEAMLDRYPHQFSGGQRQRLAIARALVTRPRLVVLDEPVSALDVSVRGEVLALLSSLQAKYGLTYLIISHDLDMVAAIADRVMVMERGRIIEAGTAEEIFSAPQQPLTKELVAARLPELGLKS